MGKYQWLEDALDSYGWLELCFLADEEMILDELARLEPDIDWPMTFDRFTSAEWMSDNGVIFTVKSKWPGYSRYTERIMQQAFKNLYDEGVSITILRERDE